MSLKLFQQLNDEDLLNHYHSTRNVKAFRHLYMRHKDVLYRYCSQINQSAADSALQQLWEDLLERPPELCGRMFRTWIFIRVNKLLEQTAEITPDLDAETQTKQVHQSKVLSAIQELPRLEKNIFLLHNECRLPLATVADIENLTLNKCRQYYRAGKEKIEEYLFGPKRQPWRVKEVNV